MGLISDNHSRAYSRILGLFWLVALGIILIAGLWPFRAPNNDITWLDKEHGLQFGHHGSVRSVNPFQPRSNSVSGTIEVWLVPTPPKGRRTILAFEGPGPSGSPFALQQNGKTLIVQRQNVDETGRYRTAEFMVEDALPDTKPVFVTVTLGAHETAVYLEGVLVKISEIQGRPTSGFTGRLVLGNAPTASDSWSGQILGLAIYDPQLPQSQVAGHYVEWTKNGGPSVTEDDQPVALYKFSEHKGDVARNEISSSTDLTIPSRYFVLKPEFLSSPWRHYHSTWGYWADVALNIAGFIPFGFLLFGYLSISTATRKAGAITMAAGFVTSLTIEVLQFFLPTRNSGMNDLFTNTFGSAVGVMLFGSSAINTLLGKWALMSAVVERSDKQEDRRPMTMCDVAIIGAGPYGLSIAAHLRAEGVDFRVFGKPMHTWLEHMPKGMRLKSEGFASSLYDPNSSFTLEAYCKERGIPYAKIGLPVPLEVFASYGLEFKKRFVPSLEDKLVEFLEQSPEGFRLRLADGEVLTARRVVLAVGLTHYEYVPPVLSGLPEEFVTHSSRHSVVDHFKGRDVAVIGAGASALDLAALLHQAGARVQVVARKSVIRFHDPPDNVEPSLLDRLRTPITGIGPGWKLFLCTNAPLLFRRMPVGFRLDKVERILGPAACWFTKPQVVGKVPLNVGMNVTGVSVQDGRVNLQLTDSAGAHKTLVVDHVIAATGYKPDLRRLTFMSREIHAKVQSIENTPVLSANFESSVRGLYFVGASAANTFGPLLRFAFGAGFTAPRLAKHLARSAAPKAVTGRNGSAAKVESPDRDEVAVR